MILSEINIYPVKSLGGLSLTERCVEGRGLTLDRRWMLVNSDGKFLSQRELPLMATISVDVSDSSVVFSASKSGSIQIPTEPFLERLTLRKVSIWDSTCEGYVYPETVNHWFTEVLGEEYRLVFMSDLVHRYLGEQYSADGAEVSFADSFPLLLTNSDSLKELNSRSSEHLPMNRFRPNLVISGSETFAPFAEDRWKKIRIGEAIFHVVKPCARCVVTTVDQLHGVVSGKEPLQTLSEFRRAGDVFPETFEFFGFGANSVLFGENLIPVNPGATVRLGDVVDVLELRN